MEYNYDWFANDVEEPYTTAGRKALQLAGAPAHDGWPHQRMGTTELPLERAGLQGRVVRRLRRRLAPRLRRRRALLRPGRGLRRHHGHRRGRLRAARREVPPADGPDLRGDALPEPREEQAGLDRHPRPGGQPHEAHQRTPALPLLRPLRARLRDPLVFQLGLHDRGRRPEDRQLRPSSRTPWSTRCSPTPTRTRRKGSSTSIASPASRRSSTAASSSSARRPWSRCAVLFNSANRQNPQGLGNSSGALGHYLMDHLWVAGGASGEFPEVADKPSADGPHRPDGIYVIRFRNTKKEKFSKVPARLRLPGRRRQHLQLRTHPASARPSRRASGSRCIGGPRGLRRVPAPLGQLRGARPERARSTSSASRRSRSR